MFRELLNVWNRRNLLEASVPRWTLADVILPASTREALEQALMQIRKHHLIYRDWGLGERHEEGVGLAFNFAGPPGTGKTICAEAIADAVGRRLYKVRYNEVESMWAGETSKNLVALFREASRQNAVLFFDEADSVAGRRFTRMDHGYERDANQSINILLSELESFDGIVIFATNLASNFDPAFERRIRTHILFELPGPEERGRIWPAQLHPRTPLDADVDFVELARRFDLSGGDIKNAVLKAAQMAAARPGDDQEKRIRQADFAAAAEQVIASRRVMEQNLFDQGPRGAEAALQELREDVARLDLRTEAVAADVAALAGTVDRLEPSLLGEIRSVASEASARSRTMRRDLRIRTRWGIALGIAALLLAGGALLLALLG